jgi:hypothetical protein
MGVYSDGVKNHDGNEALFAEPIGGFPVYKPKIGPVR